MTPRPEPAPPKRAGEVAPRTGDDRLVHLRLAARVRRCGEQVRLVGDGTAVEITAKGAATIRVHNELVELAWDDLSGETAAQAGRVLGRWQALDADVHVDLVTLRGCEGLTRAGRQVELAGPDGAVLAWQQASPAEAQRRSRSEPSA